MKKTDQFYMQMALELARQSWGLVSPNPYVGAIIVKNDKIIGRGHHAKCGSAHAEVEALRNAAEDVRGATIYVTLEPCCHHGKTGPCTEALITAGIQKVVYAMDDPNPVVSGNGKKRLEQSGIEVITGVCRKEAEEINEVFIFNQSYGLPFVALKAALSLDGKLATRTGNSQWITGEEARKKTHVLRAGYDAILIGSGTLEADNPELTVREGEFRERNPLRLVMIGNQYQPNPSSQLFQTELANTWILIGENNHRFSESAFIAQGVKVLRIKEEKGQISISELLKSLYKEGVRSIFIEGGPTIHSAFLENRSVQRVHLFYAPKLIGGKNAPSLWDHGGVSLLDKALQINALQIESVGMDIYLTGTISERGEITCLQD